uniref:Uncharacterized protein n=1 Tax=Anguilla anguilla TaxID=7936 RepID=A0A0E9VHK2_ANGAN
MIYNIDDKLKDLYWLIICLVNQHIWKTRSKMTIDHIYVSSESVYKNILTELKRRRTIDIKHGNANLWQTLDI